MSSWFPASLKTGRNLKGCPSRCTGREQQGEQSSRNIQNRYVRRGAHLAAMERQAAYDSVHALLR